MPQNTPPLLSIIIPTKNRYKTLFPVIEAILGHIESQDLELIVQDNSDSGQEATVFFQNHPDPRVRYFYQGGELSISENTILAIEKIRGTYAIFIGDDDLVSPYIVEITKKLASIDGDGLIYTPANYWWDSVNFLKENYYYKKKALWIPEKLSSGFVEKKSCDELDFVLKKGAIGYYQMPRFYHGIIKAEALHAIKNRIGTYLSGSCPDIALSTSLAFIVDRYYSIDYPVSVFGASGNSGGGWTANKTHFGKIEDQKFLQKGIIDRWDPNIPLIWSERTIYPQTVFETLKAFNSNKTINYIAFYASMLANERFLYQYWVTKVKAFCKGKPIVFFRIMLTYLKISTGIRLSNVKKRTRSFGYSVIHKQSVFDCMETLAKIKFEEE